MLCAVLCALGMERFQQLMLKLEAGTASNNDHVEIEQLSDRLFGDGSTSASASPPPARAFALAAAAASSRVLLSPKREHLAPRPGSPSRSPKREHPSAGVPLSLAPQSPHRAGSPTPSAAPSSPRSAAAESGSPRPVVLHSQQ